MFEIIKILKNAKKNGYEIKNARTSFFSKHTELTISDKTKLYSILVIQKESPEYDEKYYKTKKERIVSTLQEAVNRKMFENNNSLNKELEEYLEKKGIKREDNQYYPEMDKRIAEIKKKLKYEIEPELIKEEYFYHLIDKENMDEEKAEKKSESLKKDSEIYLKIKNNIKKPRIEIQKIRYYDNQLPKEIIKFLPTGWFQWQQIYFMVNEDKKEIEVATGSYKGSGTRESHGLFAHFFASHYDQVVETLVLEIDQENVKNIALPGFIAYAGDLRGNYVIDRDESEKIMRMSKTIYSIEDLDFEHFILTGKRVKS